MASVLIGDELARRFTDGRACVEVPAKNFRDLVRLLEAEFPGLGTVTENDFAIAIDGEIFQHPLTELIETDSEVCLIARIEGG